MRLKIKEITRGEEVAIASRERVNEKNRASWARTDWGVPLFREVPTVDFLVRQISQS